MESLGINQEVFTPDNLLGGDAKIVTMEITVASGAGALARGAILGKVTASGKYLLSLAAAEDGSQAPDCVLSEAVDATAADVVTIGYFSGQFRSAAVTLGEGHTVASVTDGLRDKNIYLV